MNKQEALLQYLVHFHIKRDYFECHEILEEYWKIEGRKNPLWVGLIQFASAFYHYRRENLPGARRLLVRARRILSKEKKQLEELGFSSDSFIELITDTIGRINLNQRYVSIHIPIYDMKINNALKIAYHNHSTMEEDEFHYIKNKHKLRDRSKVIQDRQDALLENMTKR